MATITATTGAIDVNGIVSQLMQIERAPLTKLAQSKTGLQTKLTAVGKIASALSAFQEASRSLTTATTWQAATAKSADAKTVDASAASGAPIGNYSVVVSRLAQRQSGATGSYLATTTVIGGGTLHIQMGNSNDAGTSFAADSARPAMAVTIPADASLSDVVSAINTADTGVVASTVKDGTSYRILIRSRDSGASNAFALTVAPTAGSGLAALAFSPTAGGAGVSLNQTAQDARYNLSGLALTAPSNRIDGVLSNVSLDLRQVSSTAVSVDIASDTEALRKSVEKFVSTYNDLNKVIAEQTKYDATSKSAGTLQGDNTFVTLQSQLRQVFSQTLAGGDMSRLSDAGITIQADGSLALNASKFDQVAANPKRLQALFANNETASTASTTTATGTTGTSGTSGTGGTGGTSGTTGIANGSSAASSTLGFAKRFVDLATRVLGNDGAINGSQERLRRQVTSLTNQQTRLEQRLSDTEKRLLRTYSALNTNVAKIQAAGARYGSSSS